MAAAKSWGNAGSFVGASTQQLYRADVGQHHINRGGSAYTGLANRVVVGQHQVRAQSRHTFLEGLRYPKGQQVRTHAALTYMSRPCRSAKLGAGKQLVVQQQNLSGAGGATPAFFLKNQAREGQCARATFMSTPKPYSKAAQCCRPPEGHFHVSWHRLASSSPSSEQ